MKKVLLALFLIAGALLKSQTIDSLIRISFHFDSDTEKVNLFYTEGFANRLRSPQYSYECAKQAEYFGARSGSLKHAAKANNLLGVLYYRKGNLKKALDYHQKALEARENCNDEQGIAFSETNLGNIYTDLKKFDLAEKSYLRALHLNSKLGNDVQSGNCYINLGVLKTTQGELKTAENYFYSAYKVAKKLMDYELEALCLNNLSVINIETKNYESAIGNCMDALKIKEIIGNEVEKTDSYINLAKSYHFMNDTANCTYYLRKADSCCRVFDYPEAKITLLELKSMIFENNNNFELAFRTYKEYIHLKDSMNNANKNIDLNIEFVEEKTTSPVTEFKFPYLMMITLFALSFLIIYTVVKFKR